MFPASISMARVKSEMAAMGSSSLIHATPRSV